MSVKKIKNEGGFTLIESLVYIGLFGVIIGGTLLGVYQIIEGSERITAKTELQEEANFLFQKINWAANGSALLIPAPNGTSSLLRFDKLNFSDNPLEFTVQDENLFLSRAGGSPKALNSSWVKVDDAIFEHIIGTTSLSRILKIRLFLDGEIFETAKYL